MNQINGPDQHVAKKSNKIIKIREILKKSALFLICKPTVKKSEKKS